MNRLTTKDKEQLVRKSIGEIVTGRKIEMDSYPFPQLESSGLPKLVSGSS